MNAEALERPPSLMRQPADLIAPQIPEGARKSFVATSTEGEKAVRVPTSLNPLSEWVCDTCNSVIESADDGCVEWIYAMGASALTQGASEFRIVHTAGTNKRGTQCYAHSSQTGHVDLPLRHLVGAVGLVKWLAFLDVGPLHAPTAQAPAITDYRNYTETMRRLFVPNYEEARLYWDLAEHDGFFSGANEVWPYLPDTLAQLCDQYRTTDEGQARIRGVRV